MKLGDNLSSFRLHLSATVKQGRYSVPWKIESAFLRANAIAATIAIFSPTALAQSQWKVPNWQPVALVESVDDKNLADDAFQISCSENEIISKVECDSRQAAIIILRDKSTLFILRHFSMGSCGDYEFFVFGPTAVGKTRSVIRELNSCASALKFRWKKDDTEFPEFLIDGVREEGRVAGKFTWLSNEILFQYQHGEWTSVIATQK